MTTTALGTLEIERTIPTNLGRSVHVALTSENERVLVKRADDLEWAADLDRQARHFTAMKVLLGEESIYPPVLARDERELVIPFYAHGSVDDLSLGPNHELVRELTARSLDALFRLAAIKPPDAGRERQRAEAAATFLVTEAQKRVDRLARAIADSPVAREWAAPARLDMISRATAWAGAGLAGTAPILGPRKLGLASHGDFGLNNVMLVDPPAADARIVFIDTRGRWIGSYPWWDPIMDLATLIAFHCRIEPALAEAGERTSVYATSRGRLRESEILDLCASSGSFAAWIEHDSRWRARLEVEIATRILGNVSVQLLTAPENAAERATVVLSLLIDQADRVGNVLESLPRL